MPEIPLMRVGLRRPAARDRPAACRRFWRSCGDDLLRLRRDRPARPQGDPGARKRPDARKAERIYVGAFEVFREYGPDGTVTLERETLHVFDDKHRLALVETRTAARIAGPAS